MADAHRTDQSAHKGGANMLSSNKLTVTNAHGDVAAAEALLGLFAQEPAQPDAARGASSSQAGSAAAPEAPPPPHGAEFVSYNLANGKASGRRNGKGKGLHWVQPMKLDQAPSGPYHNAYNNAAEAYDAYRRGRHPLHGYDGAPSSAAPPASPLT